LFTAFRRTEGKGVALVVDECPTSGYDGFTSRKITLIFEGSQKMPECCGKKKNFFPLQGFEY